MNDYYMSGNALIRVVGVGGGGNNAVNRMMEEGLYGVDFIAVNTDSQVLNSCSAPQTIILGQLMTRGLGAGGKPEIGRKAALESENELRQLLQGSDMVFVTAGMGGGTGTGAAPIVSRIAREVGALTIGVVTKPFAFEGTQRTRIAKEGISELKEHVDTLIVIPNDRLLEQAHSRITFPEALRLADDVLRQGIQGISELITTPGIINLDFADVRTIMSTGGDALMAVGHGHGENRAVDATRRAMESNMLDISVDGAKGILFNITGGNDLSLMEINYAVESVRALAHPDVNLIFGAVIDDRMQDAVRVTVIATNFDNAVPPALERRATSWSNASTSTPKPVAKPQRTESVSARSEADDFELPAFLRRRK